MIVPSVLIENLLSSDQPTVNGMDKFLKLKMPDFVQITKFFFTRNQKIFDNFSKFTLIFIF